MALRAERSSNGSPPSLSSLCHPWHCGSSQLSRSIHLLSSCAVTQYAVGTMAANFKTFPVDSPEDFLRLRSTGTMQFKFKSTSLGDGEDSSFSVAGSIRGKNYPDFSGKPLTKGILVSLSAEEFDHRSGSISGLREVLLGSVLSAPLSRCWLSIPLLGCGSPSAIPETFLSGS